MSVVPPVPAPTRNTWTCPTCKHGSLDPRDELAHLDAHRQLGRFLDEWDAAVASDREKERNRRPAAVVLAGLAALVALVAAVVFWGFGRTGGSSRPVAGPVPAPNISAPSPMPAPVPAPAVATPAPAPAEPAPDTSQLTPAAPAPTAPAQRPARNTVAAPSTAPAAAQADSVAPVTPAPGPPVPSGVAGLQTFRTGPPVSPPTYLLQICVFGTCLTIP